MRMRAARGRVEGFSLIELMMAMVVTMIMGGAVVGLLVSANRAFRREPEVAERQQNARVAMDMITRDIASAGSGLPAFSQVFTPGFEGGGTAADALEMITNTAGLDSLPLCATVDVDWASPAVYLYADTKHITEASPGVAGTDVAVLMSACATTPAVGKYWLRQVTSKETSTTAVDGCPALVSVKLGLATVRGELDALLPDGKQCRAYAVQPVTRVRYQVGDEGGMPVLQRVVGGSVQVVAWGIEDMQVRYRSAKDIADLDAFVAPVVAVVPDDYTTLTIGVEVSLWSRTLHGNIQGASAATEEQAAAVRGQLISRVAPRSALYALSSNSDATTRVWY
jgi:Tfp pilus assembly protein PilV